MGLAGAEPTCDGTGDPEPPKAGPGGWPPFPLRARRMAAGPGPKLTTNTWSGQPNKDEDEDEDKRIG